ncbi:protein FAR1-RELATED SEQUENCE 1-like [Apium graveolens]|uniref:protein FAR1-RELATED SEQUENCE 1-like n=1 Tax=Apium graveolens TaxID=4045 RepID=UPI003D7A56D6
MALERKKRKENEVKAKAEKLKRKKDDDKGNVSYMENNGLFEGVCDSSSYDMVEELIEGFYDSFSRTTNVWNPKVLDHIFKPYVGQRFKDIESCFSFYTEYGVQGGFNIRKSTQKVKNKIVVTKYLVCQKAGHYDTSGPKDSGGTSESSHTSGNIGEEVKRRNTVTKKCHCNAKETSDGGFFYEYQTDSDGHLTRLFWADVRGRRNYEVFGDVVSFDATYRTNKYGMVFVPFIGVNNHWKSVTFASSLLNHENETNFTWACEMVLKVFGRPPKCIITDQCLAMKTAISKVFPDCIHRYCMWHIMQKFPAKIGPVFCAESGFMEKLNKFVWSSHLMVAEFESGWDAVLKEFGLSEHVWLNEIYAMRKSWIPAFFRDKPMGALLRTTSRSESTNFYFNHFVQKGDTLSEFYMCYESAIKKQNHESKKLTNGDTCIPKLVTEKNIEKHAAQVYTRLWGVERIPYQFLSSRWMRNTELRFSKLKFCKKLENGDGSIIRDTSKKIWTEFQGCLGSVSNDNLGLTFMLEGMRSLKISIDEKFNKCAVTKNDILQETFGVRPSGVSKVLPPHQSNTKGSRKRIVSGAELSRDGKKRKLRMCKTCNIKSYHDSRKCPNKLNGQLNKELEHT